MSKRTRMDPTNGEKLKLLDRQSLAMKIPPLVSAIKRGFLQNLQKDEAKLQG